MAREYGEPRRFSARVPPLSPKFEILGLTSIESYYDVVGHAR
jgi:hypothetical protein